MSALTPIRILTVDDHPLFRSGIAALLATQPDMSLVAEASNGREAVQQYRAHRVLMECKGVQLFRVSVTC